MNSSHCLRDISERNPTMHLQPRSQQILESSCVLKMPFCRVVLVIAADFHKLSILQYHVLRMQGPVAIYTRSMFARSSNYFLTVLQE